MGSELKILLLEDSENDAGLIERVIRKDGISFVGKRVDKREEFIDAIHSFQPDVVLSDHSLPQFNSMEALKLCRKHGLRVPFILVTGSMSDEFAVKCLKEGADDYILKSNLTRLPSAIKLSVKQHLEERQRIAAEWDRRKQNEELVKINKELDSFVYSVSHNLRSPLMSVLGLINLAQREDKSKEGNLGEYFSLMESSIHKLDDTLKEILDYSKNSRYELDVKEVDLRRIIDDSFESMKFMSGFERLRWDVRYQGDVPLRSDAYRLHVIFNNLVSNAVKYQDYNKARSSVHVSVSITPETLSIVFEDNGVGIQKELQAKIFDMFFRANDRGDGSGLGLYIVKETVRRLKGKIRATSRLGEGTTFKIEIPNSPVPQEILLTNTDEDQKS